MVDAKNICQSGHCGFTSTVCGFNIRDYGNEGHIDHIMVYDKGNSVRVLQHATVTQMWDKYRPPSDHWPVIADVEVGSFASKMEL